MNIPLYLIIHHTGGVDTDPLADTSEQSFSVVNEYHRQKWNFRSSLGYYIGYHYYIDKSGKVTQGRKDTDEGAHTIGMNLQSIGCCMAGNFDVTKPTEAQCEALKSLIANKMQEYGISIECVVPHRHFANKTCYGKHLSDDWCRNLVKPVDKPIESCITERAIIETQKVQISRLEALIQSIINWFFNKK
jgi:hypothetical protein